MKTNHLLTISCITLLSLSGFARNFSPQEAMRAIPTKGSFELVETQCDSYSEPTAYVFSKGLDKGFVVMSARGEQPVLLGFSDTGTFDSSNVPPAFRAFMENYTQPSPVASRATRPAILPLCSTTWNQSAPYNQFCPTHDGLKSLTGCGATAMAQIMKFHNYPANGQGSNTYEYVYNNLPYSLSLDFSTISIDWGAMQPSYPSSFSSTAAEIAVARLMRYCGIAACSTYSPVETSTMNIKALTGLIDYFNYDAGLTFVFREWFTADEWEELIYNELSNNRPVYYNGNPIYGSGHIFVCDGYNDAGYFHINWGWGGSCDGYFALPDLQPANFDYRYWQRAGIGIRPDAGGSQKVQMYISGLFDTDLDSYTRGINETISFEGGFFSSTLQPAAVELAIKYGSAPAYEYTRLAYAGELPPDYGWSTVRINADDLPTGEYDVQPVFREYGTDEWKPLFHNTEYHDFLHFKVTDQTVTVCHTDKPMNSIDAVIADDNAPVQYFNLQGIPVENPKDGIFIKVKGSERTKVRL